MAMVIPGKNAFATTLAAGSYSALLFTSNTTPAEGDVLGDYTEATFDGYAPINLTGASVTAARITWDGLTWTFTGTDPGQTVYGVCVYTGSTLIWVKRFDSPVTVSEASPNVNYTPTFTL